MFKKIFIITLTCFVISLGCKDKDNTDYTPLMKAVISGNVSRVKSLLEQGADINAQNKNGQTALILASYYKRNNTEKIFPLLLENNAIIDLQDSSGRTALSWAAGAGKMEAIRHLLSANANINLQDSDGATPLMWASLMGQKDAFLYLLENGADVSIKDKNGLPVFIRHTPNHHIKSLFSDLAIKAPTKNSERYLSSLHWAAINNNPRLITNLVQKGYSVNLKDHTGATPLIRAAGNGNYKSIQTLLHLGADIHATDNEGYNALFWVITNIDSPKTIKILLEHGLNVNSLDKNNKTPLMWAIEKGFNASVKYLLANGANPNMLDNNGNTALHLAIKSNKLPILKTLLESGSDSQTDSASLYPFPLDIFTLIKSAKKHKRSGIKVDFEIKNKDGDTPLIYAVWKENLPIIKELIKFGADVNGKGIEGITPLLVASSLCKTAEIPQILIDAGANVNEYTDTGMRNPLILASAFGKKDTVKLLLKRGVDINATNKMGETALFFASTLFFHQDLAKDLPEEDATKLLKNALEEQLNTLKLLIKSGADINTTTLENKTPLMWAVSLPGHTKIVELLLEAGANISYKNNNGKTALDIAKQTKDEETIALLKRRFSNEGQL